MAIAETIIRIGACRGRDTQETAIRVVAGNSNSRIVAPRKQRLALSQEAYYVADQLEVGPNARSRRERSCVFQILGRCPADRPRGHAVLGAESLHRHLHRQVFALRQACVPRWPHGETGEVGLGHHEFHHYLSKLKSTTHWTVKEVFAFVDLHHLIKVNWNAKQ